MTVEATAACGPGDGPWVDVTARGADGRSMVAELVVNGETIAFGAGIAPQTIGIDLFKGSLAWQDPTNYRQVRGAVTVRDPTGGPVLGRDDSVAPRTTGCG